MPEAARRPDGPVRERRRRVGPHVDNYDVFLIQVEGAGAGSTACSKDLALVPGSPLKILRRFEAWHECVLEPGDMLYLPQDGPMTA